MFDILVIGMCYGLLHHIGVFHRRKYKWFLFEHSALGTVCQASHGVHAAQQEPLCVEAKLVYKRREEKRGCKGRYTVIRVGER